jgi:hypothetical protein
MHRLLTSSTATVAPLGAPVMSTVASQYTTQRTRECSRRAKSESHPTRTIRPIGIGAGRGVAMWLECLVRYRLATRIAMGRGTGCHEYLLDSLYWTHSTRLTLLDSLHWTHSTGLTVEPALDSMTACSDTGTVSMALRVGECTAVTACDCL